MQLIFGGFFDLCAYDHMLSLAGAPFMTRDDLRRRANQRFRRFLRSTRATSGKSAAEVAAALGMTELELKIAERIPAQIPCCTLYRIIEVYGRGAMFDAEVAFQELERLGKKFRAAQTVPAPLSALPQAAQIPPTEQH